MGGPIQVVVRIACREENSMKQAITRLLRVLIVLLPWRLRRIVLERVYGYRFGKGSRIGPLSWIFPDHLLMSEEARIASLTVAIHLNRVEMGDHSSIGRGNWITGHKHGSGRFAHREGRDSALIVGRHSAITKSHIIDCTDRVTIGEFTTIAGYHSQIITHGIDVNECRQDCKPIEIGSYCLVGTGVICLGGARLPDRSVLAAGAVLAKEFCEVETLYAGAPARAVKKLAPEAGYFKRDAGYVW